MWEINDSLCMEPPGPCFEPESGEVLGGGRANVLSGLELEMSLTFRCLASEIHAFCGFNVNFLKLDSQFLFFFLLDFNMGVF